MRPGSLWASVMEAAFLAGRQLSRSQPRRRQRPLRFERLEDKTLLAADLTLDISDGAASVDPGGTVVYFFEYANNGDAAAADAILHTTVPAHASYAPESNDSLWSCTDGDGPRSRNSCTLELGDVEVGASHTVEFAVTVDSNLSSRVRRISNRGYISGDDDGWHRNDFGSAVTPVIGQFHDLQVDVSDADAMVSPGDSILYTLDYTNGGDAEAPGATISVKLPSHTTFDAKASSEGWTCDETSCSLSVGAVPAGGGGAATIAAVLDGDVATTVRRIHASATITDDGSGASDSNRRNNSQYERSNVVHLLPDLSIAIDDGDAGVAPGESIVYTIDYANQGTFDSTGVAITIDVPLHTTFDAVNSPAGWTCVDGICTLAVGNLASDSDGRTTFAVLVDGDISKEVRRIHASASIADDGTAGADANHRDNRAFERIAIKHLLPDVRLQVSGGDAGVAAGGSISYTFGYTNAGTLDAHGAQVRLRLPRHTTFTAEGSSGQWGCADGTCTLDVGDVGVGKSGTATLVVTVDADLSPRTRHIYLFAGISDDGASGPDADRYNNFAFARSRVDPV